MRHLTIKICGITRVEDAIAACDLGCDYIGLIFVAETPRFVEASAAKAIVQAVSGRCQVVGVFRNAAAADISSIKEEVGFDLAQLHGDESAGLASSLGSFIKAVTVSRPGDLLQAQQYGAAQRIIFDRSKEAPAQNWLSDTVNWLSEYASPAPFLIAGGVDATNVEAVCQALANNTCFSGIDVASGVESSVGIKDKTKMEALIKTAREVCSHAFAR